MIWRYFLGIAVAVFALTSSVKSGFACGASTVLRCTSDRISLSICLFGNSIFVEFLYLAQDMRRDENQDRVIFGVPVAQTEIKPWLGLGANRGSILSISSSENRFDFFSSYDTRSAGEQWKAGVNVFKFNRLEEQLSCNETQETDWLEPIYEAKAAHGQCWDRYAEAWTSSCP